MQQIVKTQQGVTTNPIGMSNVTPALVQSFKKQCVLSPLAEMVIKKFGDVNNFLLNFAPQYQGAYAQDPDRCMTDDEIPEISTAKIAYGRNSIVAWVLVQLSDLNEKLGGSVKMELNEMRDCAETIADNYGYIKMSELLLFFSRFKAGVYGKFYGKNDTLVITNALATYAQERSNAILRINRAKESLKSKIRYYEMFGEIRLNIDELKMFPPVWNSLTEEQRKWYEKKAAQIDKPGDWYKHEFTFITRSEHERRERIKAEREIENKEKTDR